MNDLDVGNRGVDISVRFRSCELYHQNELTSDAHMSEYLKSEKICNLHLI
jgi:hypothetical protein